MNNFDGFTLSRMPRIEFGRGAIDKLPAIIQQFGHSLLLVRGDSSLKTGPFWDILIKIFKQQNITWSECKIKEEPSPQMIDEIVAEHANSDFAMVLGIGGGSVLDAAKAIAGLLKVQGSVMDYLEGVGPELNYVGPNVPFIAVPTTAGTGSEATKNAVLSVHGVDGFKKSFRDDSLVAEFAIIDPDFLASCPPAQIAANGLDALTQLIESYVSLNANVMTDSLVISGLRAVRDGLVACYDSAGQDADAREKMAYGSLMSGITLANTGLGSVHGLAAPLGAFYPIPHGVVCGALLASATEINIEVMLQRDVDNIALKKYARIADVLCEKRHASPKLAWQALTELLSAWTQHMSIPSLTSYGLKFDELDHVVAHSRGSSMKTNPVLLQDGDIKNIMLRSMNVEVE